MADPFARHLTDLEIAMLVAARGSRALHQTLAEHLADCDECLEAVARAILVSRETTEGSAEKTADDVRSEAALVRGMRAGLTKSLLSSESALSRITIALNPLGGPRADCALAARSSSSPLPTLTSDDGRIVVHFRRPRPGAPPRAYVVRPAPQAPARMWIVFPDSRREFLIGDNGEVDLPGVSENELSAGRVAIELRAAEQS